METIETLLTITNVVKEKATRTVIQKLCYFLKVKSILHVEFRPYYYGPYSSEIQESLSSLVGLEFIDEECVRSSYSQWKKYTYTITEDGKKILKKFKNTSEYNKIENIIEKCRENSNFNLNILAAGAKIHYILDREGKTMNVSQIFKKAENLGWEINDQSLGKAVSLLKVLGLARENNE